MKTESDRSNGNKGGLSTEGSSPTETALRPSGVAADPFSEGEYITEGILMAYTYQKGEFGIFPAKLLEGMTPNKQVIIAWLIFRMNQDGTCFPSVEKLCKDTGIKSRTTVTRCLKELEADGYIKATPRTRDDGGCSSNEYRVFIRRQGGVQEMDTNHKKTNQTNLTSSSPTSVAPAPSVDAFDAKKAEGSVQEPEAQKEVKVAAAQKRTIFKPPTVAEVAEYVAERVKGGHPHIDPDSFVDWNQSKGWMVGSNKMKDWKAAVRTWQNRAKDQKQPQQQIPTF